MREHQDHPVEPLTHAAREAIGIEAEQSEAAHLAFRAPGHQRGLKAADYPRPSIRERAEQGLSDMAAMIGRIAAAPWDQPLVVLH